MSNIDLVILGMIKAQPQNAYEIKKNIEYRHISKWVRVSVPSIYKKVLQLEQNGYITSHIEKDGKMPEKAVYEITAKGNDYFYRLMDEGSQNEIKLFIDFNTVIVNLHLVDDERKIRYIRNIKKQIETLKTVLHERNGQRSHIPYVGKSIFEQQISLVYVLENWIIDLEKHLTEQI